MMAEYEDIKPALRFAGNTMEYWQAWRHKMRHALLEVMGMDYSPEKRLATAFEAEVEEEVDLGHSIRRRIVFQSDPYLSLITYVFIPKDRKEPGPAVVALHGHGRGVQDVLGNDEGDQRIIDHIRGANYTYPEQMAQHGFVVIAPEQRGWGETREPGDVKSGDIWRSSCDYDSAIAYLFGKTIVAERVYDVFRCIDYLSTMPEVDANRVGCMGLSGGGTVTTYASALDERIKAACISCAFSTFRGSIIATHHCLCNYQPGILKYGEQADVTGLIAPRAVLIEAGEKDGVFPVDAVRTAYTQLQEIYAAAGAEDKLEIDIFDGGHMFSGKKTFDFFARQL